MHFVRTQISVCSSKIILHGTSYFFHSEKLEDIESAADKFCLEHRISISDCKRISDYHISKCFTSDTSGINDSSFPERNDDTIVNYSPLENAVEETAAVTENLVDYSQKFGPALIVEHLGKKYSLQKYAGETDRKAIMRFCGMLALDSLQCNYVGDEFYRLTNGLKVEYDKMDLSHSDFQTDSKEKTSVYKSIQHIGASVSSWISYYWRWIALLIVIAYVVFERRDAG